MTPPQGATADEILTAWGPLLRRVTPTLGLWCFGCGGKVWLKASPPERWEEVLCAHPTCPARAMAGAR